MKHYKINPGELNKRITICETAGRTDAEGYVVGGDLLTPVRECWAKFTRTSGTEAEERGADFGRVLVRFLIRTPQDPAQRRIDRKMSVLYAGHVYDVEYANDYGDDSQYTELVCELRSNATEGPELEPVTDAAGEFATAEVAGFRRYQGMRPDTEEVYASADAAGLDASDDPAPAPEPEPEPAPETEPEEG